MQFQAKHLCLNPLVISMVIRKVDWLYRQYFSNVTAGGFSEVKKTMDIHIEVYTITASQPYTCVLIPWCNICDFSVISKVWISKKTALRTDIYHYSTKDGEKSWSSHQNSSNSRFSNSIIHTYINTLIIIIT